MSPRRDSGMLRAPDVRPPLREQVIQEVLRDHGALGSTAKGGIKRPAIEDGAIDASKMAPLEWTAPTLINSWANVGGGLTPAGYMVDNQGFVHLRGRLEGGASGTAAFVLPEALWPPYSITLTGGGEVDSQYEVCPVVVDGAGNVYFFFVGTMATAWMDGLSFDTRP